MLLHHMVRLPDPVENPPSPSEEPKGMDRIADALEAIAAAIHRHADVYLYCNDPEGGEGLPDPDAKPLPPGFRGMR